LFVKPQGLCCIYRIREEVFVQRYLPSLAKLAAGCCLVLVAACAANKGSGPKNENDFVEVPNPGVTMSPDAAATIWVPRSSVESGVPRGGELLKKGFEKATGGKETAPQHEEVPVTVAQQSVPVAPVVVSAPQPAAMTAPLKSRIAVLENGDNGLLLPFDTRIATASVGILVDNHQVAFLAKNAAMASQAERGAFALRLQQEYGANAAVFVSAPDLIAPGKYLQGAVYDCLGGVLVRTVSARIPQYAVADSAARDAALETALAELAAQVKYVVGLLPWYGKVAALDGDRAYINAGRESGIRIGQVMRVYRKGKVIPGLGFAPGERIATLEISGFIGADGAYGIVRDGKDVQANDLVSVE
jgi:hypothetical protein